jgi:hypothetical protein
MHEIFNDSVNMVKDVCVCVCRTDEILRWILQNSAVRLMIVEDVSIRVTCEIVHLMLIRAVVSAKTR